jgi:CHAP domain
MTLASWVASAIGHGVDYDGAYGYQCVDLVNDWATRGCGLHRFAGQAAAGIRPLFAGEWAWQRNLPTNAPPPGAVVIWGPSAAEGIGEAGHAAVALLADGDVLITLDQNWAGVPAATVVDHSYAGVRGWWHLPAK